MTTKKRGEPNSPIVKFDWTDLSNCPHIATTWRAGSSCCNDAWMSVKLRCGLKRPGEAGSAWNWTPLSNSSKSRGEWPHDGKAWMVQAIPFDQAGIAHPVVVVGRRRPPPDVITEERDGERAAGLLGR